MAQVAFVVHPDREEAETAAEQARSWLEARGHRVVRLDAQTGSSASGGDWRRAGILAGPGPSDHAVEAASALGHPDLAVSLGGDGTMLRTVAMAVATDTPVLGVNLGRLGYLTEVEPSGVVPAIERFLEGRYLLEERMTLAVQVRNFSLPGSHYVALNEAVVEKTDPGHTVRLATSVAGQPFVTYAADGILVATPTGSTAYNLSVRGPILSPRLRAMVVTPISPHMLFDRPLVLEPDETLGLRVEGPRSAVLVIDGSPVGTLNPGDDVECRAGPRPARLVTFATRDFHAVLRARFNLADR